MAEVSIVLFLTMPNEKIRRWQRSGLPSALPTAWEGAGGIFVTFSSLTGDVLVDNVDPCFLPLIVVTVVLLAFSFLITDGCFFF